MKLRWIEENFNHSLPCKSQVDSLSPCKTIKLKVSVIRLIANFTDFIPGQSQIWPAIEPGFKLAVLGITLVSFQNVDRVSY